MSLRLYMDVHVHGAITAGLLRRGIDVLRAQDDGADELPDPKLLDRAMSLGRVLVSNDEDLLREAALRQRKGTRFSGLAYAHELEVTIGQCITDLALMCEVYGPEDIADRVERIPLK